MELANVRSRTAARDARETSTNHFVTDVHDRLDGSGACSWAEMVGEEGTVVAQISILSAGVQRTPNVRGLREPRANRRQRP
jgi:hypothetical protein